MRTRTTRPDYPWNPDRGPKQILPFLFQAGEEVLDNADFLRENNISHVLSVTTTVSPESNDARFENTMVITVEDIKNADIVSHLKLAIEFITYARLERKSVLVHCQQGVSRSGAVVLAYLMFQLKATLYQAWHYVEGICKKHTDPNLGFEKQLLEFQSSVSTTALADLEKQYAQREELRLLREDDAKYVADQEERYLKLSLNAYYDANEALLDTQSNDALEEGIDTLLKALDIKAYHFNIDPSRYNPRLEKLLKQKSLLTNIQEKIDSEIAILQTSKL